MIITLSHQKGGVGKSTIAWNLSDIQQEKVITHVMFNDLNPAMKRFGDLVDFICISEHKGILWQTNHF